MWLWTLWLSRTRFEDLKKIIELGRVRARELGFTWLWNTNAKRFKGSANVKQLYSKWQNPVNKFSDCQHLPLRNYVRSLTKEVSLLWGANKWPLKIAKFFLIVWFIFYSKNFEDNKLKHFKNLMVLKMLKEKCV